MSTLLKDVATETHTRDLSIYNETMGSLFLYKYDFVCIITLMFYNPIIIIKCAWRERKSFPVCIFVPKFTRRVFLTTYAFTDLGVRFRVRFRVGLGQSLLYYMASALSPFP
jgi:hypothetical protein